MATARPSSRESRQVVCRRGPCSVRGGNVCCTGGSCLSYVVGAKHVQEWEGELFVYLATKSSRQNCAAATADMAEAPLAAVPPALTARTEVTFVGVVVAARWFGRHLGFFDTLILDGPTPSSDAQPQAQGAQGGAARLQASAGSGGRPGGSGNALACASTLTLPEYTSIVSKEFEDGNNFAAEAEAGVEEGQGQPGPSPGCRRPPAELVCTRHVVQTKVSAKRLSAIGAEMPNRADLKAGTVVELTCQASDDVRTFANFDGDGLGDKQVRLCELCRPPLVLWRWAGRTGFPVWSPRIGTCVRQPPSGARKQTAKKRKAAEAAAAAVVSAVHAAGRAKPGLGDAGALDVDMAQPDGSAGKQKICLKFMYGKCGLSCCPFRHVNLTQAEQDCRGRALKRSEEKRRQETEWLAALDLPLADRGCVDVPKPWLPHSARAHVFAEFLVQEFGQGTLSSGSGVIDVAGGKLRTRLLPAAAAYCRVPCHLAMLQEHAAVPCPARSTEWRGFRVASPRSPLGCRHARGVTVNPMLFICRQRQGWV